MIITSLSLDLTLVLWSAMEECQTQPLFPARQAVVALDFHPTVSVLASGSKDCTVKFFDYSKPSAKRSYRAIQEVAGIRCLNFHPSGDYMLVGTEHSTCELEPVMRLVGRFCPMVVVVGVARDHRPS